MTYQILQGDCMERLLDIPEGSIDAVVTDPPYGLGFMNKDWDIGVPSAELFRLCLRAMKPGAHLLAFGGSRTYHRLAVAIEDAGFEIRDQIMWVYGSGFPKSQDVGKAIDKAAGAEREVVGFDAAKAAQQTAKAGTDSYGDFAGSSGAITAPATDAAKQWDGWGTALKPAHEPIVVARKPLNGTVAANVLAHGTGALNIDGCRVGTSKEVPASHSNADNNVYGAASVRDESRGGMNPNIGRWPANLIHDGSDEVLAAFPDAKGQQGALTGSEPSGKMGRANCYGVMDRRHEAVPRIDSSTSAARFFYCAKASRRDRNEGLEDPGPQFQSGTTLRKVESTETKGNNHPTVKPTELMRYLCRLVTPSGGTVLDPFMGSGSTGKAAVLEGFTFIGVEIDPGYAEIADRRIRYAMEILRDRQLDLLGSAS